MKKRNTGSDYLLEFEIDKFTNSIEELVTGKSFETEIEALTAKEARSILKKNGWLFNWKLEFIEPDRTVYKLTLADAPDKIQGLMSISERPGHIYMHLLESAPGNRGDGKLFNGIPANLVAFACRRSFEQGNGGFISFQSKTKLLNYYAQTLGAYHVGGHLMIIPTDVAHELVGRYFKNK